MVKLYTVKLSLVFRPEISLTDEMVTEKVTGVSSRSSFGRRGSEPLSPKSWTERKR